jgi:hypothetical protein
MKVSKANAVALLVALEFRTAATWSLLKLRDKLKELPDMVDESAKKKAGALKGLLNQILAAAKKKEEIEVEGEAKAAAAPAKKPGPAPAKAKTKAKAAEDDEDEEDEDADDEESDDEEGAEDEDEESEDSDEDTEDSEDEETDDEDADEDSEDEETEDPEDEDTEDEETEDSEDDEDEEPAPKKKKAAAAKEPKEKVGVDKWGCKLGTRAARLNKAITGKPKTAKQIMTDAEYDKPIHGHLVHLLKKGFIVREGDTYRSKEGGKPVTTTKAKVAEKPAAKAAKAAPAPVKGKVVAKPAAVVKKKAK